MYIRINKTFFLLMVITIGALLLRIGKINYSFWNDEAHVALMAKGIIEGENSRWFFGYTPTGFYQLGTYYLTALGFILFGYSEVAARIPFILVGSIIPLLSYIVTYQITHKKTAAFIACLLVTTSQLEVAWSRQVRPYILLQALFLLFYMVSLSHHKRSPLKQTILQGIIVISAVLFHTSSFPLLLIYTAITLHRFKHNKHILIALLLVFVSSIVPLAYALDIPTILRVMVHKFDPSTFRAAFYHFRFFYWHYVPYFFVGIIALWKYNKEFQIIVLAAIIFHVTVLLRTYEVVYVRYVLLLFPFVFITTAIGIQHLLGSLKGYRLYIASALILCIILTTKTLTINPYGYQSINADVRENPLANYKLFFSRMDTLLVKYPNIPIADAWHDRTMWYANRPYLNYFLISVPAKKGQRDELSGASNITTVGELKKAVAQEKRILIIIEEWPSFTSEPMKLWVKKNLTHEYTQCDEQLANENWCLSLYSNGI